MMIVNAMFAKNLGGIEQAFIDYTEALSSRGHTVICITHPKGKINEVLEGLKQAYPKIIHYRVANFGKWDFFSKWFLSEIVKKHSPQLMVAHGNRPAALLGFAAQRCRIPLIGVVHNYWFKDVMKCKYLFCVSEDIKNSAAKIFDKNKIFKVPNLIRIGAEPEFKPYQNPPKIGVMARMVEKKGVDVFLKALEILNNKNVNFVAEIAGDGELRQDMENLCGALNLNDKVQFTGWVKDKSKFYEGIDIFCLPSLSEPFGIVLLEAAEAKKPIVASNIEGPAEILENNSTALLFEKGNSVQLAEALEKMILNQKMAKELADKGFQVAKDNYNLPVVAEKLEKTLEEVRRDN